ncbi:MAG TPA: SusE domain-containing protein [Hanamia sp.]
MKKYFNKTIIALSGLLLFTACQKTETKLDYAGVATAPVLSSNIADKDTVVLSPSDSLSTALILSWTNPNYVFSNGISSLNVNYTLQIDTVGSNFTNPKIVEISMTSVLGTNFTVGDLNAKLGNSLLLQTGVPHQIALRLESFLNQGSLPLYSNVLTYVVTPYAPPPVIAPPSSGTLYITGGATPDSWMVTGAPSSVTSPVNQQLTQISPTLYKITLQLIGGQQFLLVPVAGDWSNKYATANASSLPEGGTFAYNAANNFNGPALSGTYTVTVNFQTGVYTITQ